MWYPRAMGGIPVGLTCIHRGRFISDISNICTSANALAPSPPPTTTILSFHKHVVCARRGDGGMPSVVGFDHVRVSKVLLRTEVQNKFIVIAGIVTSMKYVKIIKVIRTIAAAKYIQIMGTFARSQVSFYKCARVSTARRRWLSRSAGLGPCHGV